MKTSSQRQSDLRERKKKSGYSRLNIWIDSDALNALSEAASCRGVTQSLVLNELLFGLQNTKTVTQSPKHSIGKNTSKGKAIGVTASRQVINTEPKTKHQKFISKKPEIQNAGSTNVTQSQQRKDRLGIPPPIQKSLWDDS